MAGYFAELEGRWDSQPQGVVGIDWSNGLSVGLAIAHIGATSYNAVTERAFPRNFTQTTGSRGVGLTYSSVSNAGAVVNTPSLVTGLRTANVGATVLIIADPSSVATPTIAGDIAGGTAEYYLQFNRRIAGTTAAGYFALSNSDVSRGADSTAGQLDGKPHVFVGTIANPSGGVPTLYRDGINVTGTTGACTLGNATNDKVGGWEGSGYSVTGYGLYLTCWWNRPLSASEVSQISADPWQIFLAPPIDIWVPSAGSGAITIDCTTGNAAAAGVTAAIAQAITINAGVGDAAAAGTTSAVTQAITINATVGDAAASGTTATIAQAITINTTAGNAAAAAATAVIELGSNITIDCTVGNAVSAGVAAQILQDITIGASVGNASAEGVTASITTGTLTLTTDDLDAIAAAVWAWPDAVSAHAKLDSILAILEA